jgi:hypothetical protein
MWIFCTFNCVVRDYTLRISEVGDFGQQYGNDLTTAHNIKGPNYAIDKNNIHKVDQNGNVNNNLPRNKEILRDALETHAGLHQ